MCTTLILALAVGQPSLESRVDAHLSPYLETGNFSGSVFVAREGEVLLSKSYGMADRSSGTPNGPQTSYYLASTSRIFTSAAILLLEQQGRLSVDDPLSRHLPDWPRGDEITIHDLLTLSAGFPNINTLPGYVSWSSSPQTPASLCEKFRDLPLEFEPGERPVHSNSNYNVLALLIERLSGRTYGEFLEQELFAPLGMTRTAHDDHPERQVADRAVGYTPVGHADLKPDPRANIHWSVKTGNGSIYSTAEDLYRFDRMLAGATLLNETSVAKLFTAHFPSVGYGWFVTDDEGSTRISIGGRSPGFGSSWIRLAEPDVTVIVLGNIYNGVPTTIASDLVAMTTGREVPRASISAAAPDPAVAAAVTGTYQFGPDFYNPNGRVTVDVRDGHVFNRQAWLIPAGDMTFIHRVYWSTLTFVEDESGHVHQLRYDRFTGEREDQRVDDRASAFARVAVPHREHSRAVPRRDRVERAR
jgi:CubicO group peptidase (beta-lactamase class C family)